MNGLSCKSGYETAWDDVTNENFVPELVHAARAVEMTYFSKLGVCEKVPRSHQVASGGKIIGVRWVDVNKGDATDVNYRSRLVGRESNVGRDDALYAFTPPLEVLRVIELCSNSSNDWRKANYDDQRCTPCVLLRQNPERCLHGTPQGRPRPWKGDVGKAEALPLWNIIFMTLHFSYTQVYNILQYLAHKTKTD